MTGPASGASAAGTPAGTAAGTPAGAVPVARVRTRPSEPELAETIPPTESITDGDPDGTTDGDTAGRPRRRRSQVPRWLLPAVLGAGLLAVLATLGLLLARPPEAETRESALTAAREYTTRLTTYDARTLDRDVERVRTVSSEEFAAEYDRTVAGLRPKIQDGQTRSTGTVRAAGLERLDDGQATVLVAVDQRLVDRGQPARTEASRVRMVLVQREGSWFIRSVERL